MKKYKLIKEYPGSPELGVEVWKKTEEDEFYLLGMANSYYGVEYIENSPEFWEEVIEFPFKVGTKFKNKYNSTDVYTVSRLDVRICTVSRENGRGGKEYSTYNKKDATYNIEKGLWVEYKEYEILSLTNSRKEEIITYENGGGSYNKKHFASYSDKNHWLECFLGSSNFWGIHSIRRNSDGEVFTLGDLITGCSFRDPRKIDSFLISDSKLYVKQWRGRVLLEDTKKYREKPLFISEDGVEMYEGSEIHIVYIEKQKILSQPKGWLKAWTPIEGEKAFSTRESAEEYLMDNKPSLSIQDVQQAIGLTAFDYVLLKKFVKDKK